MCLTELADDQYTEGGHASLYMLGIDITLLPVRLSVDVVSRYENFLAELIV